jgi:hypothetical protein
LENPIIIVADQNVALMKTMELKNQKFLANGLVQKFVKKFLTLLAQMLKFPKIVSRENVANSLELVQLQEKFTVTLKANLQKFVPKTFSANVTTKELVLIAQENNVVNTQITMD